MNGACVVGSHQLAVLKRIGLHLGQAILTVLGASILIWGLLPLTPGDPAMRLLQARGIQAPLPAEIQGVRSELGLDRPLPLQYVQWLGRALRGDLSDSFQSGKPVLHEIGQHLPATALLGGTALCIALVFSIAAALLSVAFHERVPDQIVRALTQIGAITPSFLAGLLVLYLIVLRLGWGQIIASGRIEQVWLPAACLAIGLAADWTQLLRANLLEAIHARFIIVAIARGATPLRVLVRYALPNALLPLVTAMGVGVGALLGGAPIIETVFTWPGLGSYMVEAIAARDLPVIQGFVALGTLVYVTTSLLVDAISALLDPRIREGGGS